MAAVTLTDLNNFMRDFPSLKIRPDALFVGTLYDALKATVKTERYVGDKYDMLVQTHTNMSGQAFARGVSIPASPAAPAWVKLSTKYAEMVANTGVTSQDLRDASGGNASWEKLSLRLLLDLRKKDFKNLTEHCSIGDGSGRLARCAGGATYAAGPPKLVTLLVDNTYDDWGWENAALVQKDMWVEAYRADGTTQVAETASPYATSWKVNHVHFGDRANGVAVTPSSTVAAIVIEVAEDISALFNDGAIIYRKGTRSLAKTISDAAGTALFDAYTILPMGLTGLVGDGSHQKYLTKFQNQTRATYDIQNAGIYGAPDFASGAHGVPDTFDLSDITGIMNTQEQTSGKWVSDLFCSVELAMCLHRLNRSESGVNVVVSNTAGQNQAIVGSEIAKQFIRPDGKPIPIHVSRTIPKNCLYGICAEDLFWLVDEAFDFMGPRLGLGGPWIKTMADRLADFEAPFGGESQVAAEACNAHFLIMDLKDNL